MPDSGDILFIIPARGGSKRLPGKNLLPLSGKPMICWSIDAALDSELDATIIVTSDSAEILSIADRYPKGGVIAHRRPSMLATDDADTAGVVLNAICHAAKLGYEAQTMVLLQPTSPLRSFTDITAALALFDRGERQQSVVSVTGCDAKHKWAGTLDRDKNFFLGQDAVHQTDFYCLNGAVYISDVAFIRETHKLLTENLLGYEMPVERSIDVDTSQDFELCKSLIARRLSL